MQLNVFYTYSSMWCLAFLYKTILVLEWEADLIEAIGESVLQIWS